MVVDRNIEFLWLQIFDKVVNCTNNLVYRCLEHCAKDLSVQFIPDAAPCKLNGKILKESEIPRVESW